MFFYTKAKVALSSGQFCGVDALVSSRPYAYFPRLGEDIAEAVASGALSLANPLGFATFRPYALCVEACPSTFSLTNAQAYGGPTYPYRNATEVSAPPVYYATTGTQRAALYCLPTSEPAVSASRQLCNEPVCTDAPRSSAVAGA